MPPSKHRRIPSSAIAAFIRHDEIDAILAPFVPDARDREWLLRCILDAGPAHHRGANFVLLELLGTVLDRLPPSSAASGSDPHRLARVPMRVPPHDRGPRGHGPQGHGPHEHEHEHEHDEAFFPIGIPGEVLDHLAPAGSREQAAMIDCLTDGPPQHSLANAVMVRLLGEILARLPERATPAGAAPE
nr:hypothetical protein [Myxococcota bacterium]